MPQQPDRRPLAHRVWRRMDLAERVMDRMGIDRTALARTDNGATITQVMLNCIHCQGVEQCREWLNTSQVDCAPPPHCPNRSLFAKCTLQTSQEADDTP